MIGPVLLSGFLVGAAGSLHCVGMCGPLSLALPVHRLSPAAKFFSLLSYQVGRIITYAAIGLIFGIMGRRMYLSGYQQWFSILLGTVILAFGILYFANKYVVRVRFFSRFSFISNLIGRLIKKASNPFGFLLLGMANGLLPCGMVYVALFTTLSFTEIIHSVAFMAMFGAGTLPAMMLAAYAVQRFTWKSRLLIRQIIPFFIIVIGLLLVLRGLNLGIPFISPIFQETKETLGCH